MILLTCQNSTEPPPPPVTLLQGSVYSVETGNIITNHPTYIFWNDSLITTTDVNGNYSISDIIEGTYNLLCSSINYRDTIEQVQVIDGETTNHNFYLTTDSSIGLILGEFQDVTLFNQAVIDSPEILTWTAQEIYEEVTGATLQAKFLGYDVPDRIVYLDGDDLSTSDGYGQYLLFLQTGTYSFRGTCEGYYQEVTKTFKVLPGTNYLNFFLPRVLITKRSNFN
jgi:hypothetical protein